MLVNLKNRKYKIGKMNELAKDDHSKGYLRRNLKEM